MIRPASILLFEKVFFACMALSVLGIAFGWSEMVATAAAQSPGIADAVPMVMIVAVVIGVAVPVLLWFFIARRASNIAKWTYVVLTAIGVLMYLSSLANPAVAKSLMTIFGGITTVLQVWSAWLLFKPDAATWLESKGVDGPGDPATFD